MTTGGKMEGSVLRLILVALLITGAAALSTPTEALPTRPPKVTAEEVREAEESLNELGYWVARTDGVFDAASRHALIAFQKVEGRPRTGVLTPAELQAIKAAQPPAPLESGYMHVEIDLKRQVLFVVSQSDGVKKVLPVSTGNGKLFTSEGYTRRAVTPTGRFKVYRKLFGWRKSPLGLLYYPSYILAGIAIHGNPSVPAKPASHGCIRIPMFAAKGFSDMAPIGTPVIVYDGSTPPSNVEEVPSSLVIGASR
jgi:hypothetical protein